MNKLSRKDIAMLEVLAVTEESKGKLTEYIQQREKAAKAYKAFREAVVNGVEVEGVAKEKTPNELRAEVIQQAKEFIENTKKKKYKGYTAFGFGLPGEGTKNIYRDVYVFGGEFKHVCDVEFVANQEKRTLVALMRGIVTKKIYSKGIAKCSPHDVFNEHVGKAIALGRALGKDVSEFENAVQPTEPVVGHVVKGNGMSGPYRQDRKFTLTSKKDCDSFYYAENYRGDFIYSTQIGDIIDDTNAIYRESVE